MKSLLKGLFVDNWQRKLIAVLAGLVIWLLVNYTITVTRTIPNVPIHVLNIPKEKTIEGLLPNGILSRRATLVVTGKKSVVEKLSSSDIEIVTDASGMGDSWTFEVTKRNLKATSPDVDVQYGVNQVSPVEVSIQLSPLVTEKIPITITAPVGELPKGYIFLDIWPQRLMQTVSGPKPQVDELKTKGLRLTLNLNRITGEELDNLFANARRREEDEIRFFVPDDWKKVYIPFEKDKSVEINDPEAAFLHIDFLKQESLPLESDLPVAIFFPLPYSLTLNPDTYSIGSDGLISIKNGIPILNLPLYVQNVSRQFLDTVRNQIELTFIATPRSVEPILPWSIQFIDPMGLEEAYVKDSMENVPLEEGEEAFPKLREEYLRNRFRKYMREFELVKKDAESLHLKAELGAETIRISE